MKKLAGRTAVVTGGASGLGAAMARLFASEGMRVVVADIAAGGAAEVARARDPEPARRAARRATLPRDARADPPAFEERIEALRAAIARADEEPT